MNVAASETLVNIAFELWMKNHNLDYFRKDDIIKALNTCLDDCIRLHDDSPAFYEDAITEEDINEQLFYISDRWFCSSRIRFILRVIGQKEDNMKFEFKIEPETSFEYTRGKCYFVKDNDDGKVSAAYITGWSNSKPEVIYFRNQNSGFPVTYSDLKHFKECYTIISEINHIAFGVE